MLTMAKSMRIMIWGAVVMALAACSRHSGEFPPTLALVVAPAPSNFAVTTGDNVLYTLTWEVSDPTTVAYYRLYTLDLTGIPVPRDTTSVSTVQVDTQVPTPGLVFGVSSVSVGSVESSIVYGSAR